MADYITEMANQIVAMSRRIDAIESDRVARMAELERKLLERIDTLVAGCNSHSRRIEDLERLTQHTCEALGRDGVAGRLEALEETGRSYLDAGEKYVELQARFQVWSANHAVKHGELEKGLGERLHTLERGEKELYARCQEVAGAALAALQDRDRQDRWHASYNAALGSNAVSGVEARHINAVHESCAAAADRAHGPLEASATPATPGWAAWDARVEALVKAARWALTPGNHPWVEPLREALLPFESRGGE